MDVHPTKNGILGIDPYSSCNFRFGTQRAVPTSSVPIPSVIDLVFPALVDNNYS